MLDSLEDLFSDNRDISIAMRKIQALSVLSFICRHKREYVSRVSESDRIIYEIIAFISSHYGEEITLESLSHKFSVSKSHLSRRFKEVSGIGLNDYIQHVRIMNAERLLLEGGSSITEIAESCGFNDSNYFSTVFKRQKGITPLRFAQSKKVDRN